jgi:hypothetical protein
MVTFQIPLKEKNSFISVKVKKPVVLFAGSRYGSLPKQTSALLVEAFGRHGFSFLVGCANGIDSCFRCALVSSIYSHKTLMACAFTYRAKSVYSFGLPSSVVVPADLPPKLALRRRTGWLVRHASLAVLFPENPYTHKWGAGSSLAFWSCMYRNKPVFVVSSLFPKRDIHYLALPSSLFGVVSGYWAIPQLKEGTVL